MSNTARDIQRAEWMLKLLRACATSEEVQALPIQEKRGKVVESLRATLKYYKQIGKAWEAVNCYQLCLLVERSETVHNALADLKKRISQKNTEHNSTPDSNTGVRTSAHQMLEDYIGGYKHG